MAAYNTSHVETKSNKLPQNAGAATGTIILESEPERIVKFGNLGKGNIKEHVGKVLSADIRRKIVTNVCKFIESKQLYYQPIENVPDTKDSKQTDRDKKSSDKQSYWRSLLFKVSASKEARSEVSPDVKKVECVMGKTRRRIPGDPNFRDITEIVLPASKEWMNTKEFPESNEYNFKFLILGEVAVGKTSFVGWYQNQYFSSNYRSTIGVDFWGKKISWDNGEMRIKLHIWDIAGNERTSNMARILYRDAAAVFIVFDVTRPETLKATKQWKQDLDERAQLYDGSPVPCVLIGNKCDLAKYGMANNERTMDMFVEENGFLKWFEVSSKTGNGVEEAFSFIVKEVIARMEARRKEEVAFKLTQRKINRGKCSC